MSSPLHALDRLSRRLDVLLARADLDEPDPARPDDPNAQPLNLKEINSALLSISRIHKLRTQFQSDPDSESSPAPTQAAHASPPRHTLSPADPSNPVVLSKNSSSKETPNDSVPHTTLPIEIIRAIAGIIVHASGGDPKLAARQCGNALYDEPGIREIMARSSNAPDLLPNDDQLAQIGFDPPESSNSVHDDLCLTG